MKKTGILLSLFVTSLASAQVEVKATDTLRVETISNEQKIEEVKAKVEQERKELEAQKIAAEKEAKAQKEEAEREAKAQKFAEKDLKLKE